MGPSLASNGRVEVVPFEDRHLTEAARLLFDRHESDRRRLPILPERSEVEIAEAVESAWRRPGAAGAVALESRGVIGYLIGDVTVDTGLGRSAWVRLPGHAVAAGADVDLYRDLYAAAAPSWLAQGAFEHRVLVSASSPAVREAFAALRFGLDQAYGILSLSERGSPSAGPPSIVEVRRAHPDDRPSLEAMAGLIASHQARPPSWIPVLPESLAELREGYGELVNDEEATVFVADSGGKLVGFQAYFPAEPSSEDLITPSGTVELKVGASVEGVRGKGVGKALTVHGLGWASAAGYRYCSADWHVPNLLSSRFWPRRGFRAVAHRMYRRIDERIAWAR